MKKDKKIIVISGTSSGIGFCAVEQLSKMGNLIFAGARKEEDLARLSSMENVRAVKLDVTSAADITNLVQTIEAGPGYIDVLVNNAGVPGWGAIMERDVEYFEKIMEVNYFGQVRMIQSFYPLLRRSKSSPIIINMSSQAGNYAFPFWAPYHSSKWALEALSDCLRRELRPLGIRVAVIQPGAIKSNAFQNQTDEFENYRSGSSSEFRSRAVRFLQGAFEREIGKEPQLVVNAILHAIYNPKNKLRYQPGLRLIPDILAAKLPKRLVDTLITRK